MLASFLSFANHHQVDAPDAMISISEEATGVEWSDKMYNLTRSKVSSSLTDIWSDTQSEQVLLAAS
jgi:hypothetical protein